MLSSGIAIAVSSKNAARKKRIETAAQQAVLDTIAAADRAGTGYPSDEVLRTAVLAAIDAARQEP